MYCHIAYHWWLLKLLWWWVVFCSVRNVGELQTRQTGKCSGKQNPKQSRWVWTSVSPWGSLRKVAQATKLQWWERRQGRSAPGHSPVVQHKNTPPSAQVRRFKKKLSLQSSYVKLHKSDLRSWKWTFSDKYETFGLHVFIAVSLMRQCFWGIFTGHTGHPGCWKLQLTQCHHEVCCSSKAFDPPIGRSPVDGVYTVAS